MSYKKLAKLTSNLQRRTLSGKIDWQETAWRDMFQASLANYSVRVSLVESQSAEGQDVKISIVNEEGVEVESFRDVDLKQQWFSEVGTAGHPYEVMLNIYQTARRAALGSEKAVSDILEELDKLDEDEIPF